MPPIRMRSRRRTSRGPRPTAGSPVALTAALTAVLAMGVAEGVPAQDTTGPGASGAAEAEVLEELVRYYADFSARDWPAFASHFWPGATLTSIWQPPGSPAPEVVVTTVPEFVEQAPAGPGSREIFAEWMEAAEVRVTGGLAQAWVRYGARFGDPGDVMEWQGTDAFTLLRHDGRWKIVALAYAADEEEAEPMSEISIVGATPVLYVEAIEPILPFWVDRLGFERVSEGREGDRLGFVILERDGVQLMAQTRASLRNDLPALADHPMGGTLLFIRVRDLDAIADALRGVELLVPRRTTDYGSEEIWVREPGGNVVGFARFPGPESDPE